MTHVREIGSFFNWPDRLHCIPNSTPPWESADIQYYQSGRQALYAAATHFYNLGIRDVYVPDYICESVYLPLIKSGLELHYLPLDAQLRTSSRDIDALPAGSLLVHIPMFGRHESPELRASLRSAEARGVTVLTDETHQLLGAYKRPSKYGYASLHKLLPLPDGGYTRNIPQPSDLKEAVSVETKLTAMTQKPSSSTAK